MKVKGIRLVMLCISLLACSDMWAQETQSPTAQRIVIESAWAGLGMVTSSSDHFVIVKDGDIYKLSGSHDEIHMVIEPLRAKSSDSNTGVENSPSGKMPTKLFDQQIVSPDLVMHLRDAMLDKAQPTVDLNDLKPAVNDAPAQIGDILKQDGLDRAAPPVAEKITKWRQGFNKPPVLAQALTRGFSSATHTDDFSELKITMTFSDGSTLSVSSHSQHYLMLPWKAADGGFTYSSAIAHAVSALLPDGAINRDRLQGVISADDLREALYAGLAPDVERFQVISDAPKALEVLEKNFVVSRIAINSWNGSNVDADIRLPESPPNLTADVRMPLAGEALKTERDISNVSGYLRSVQSSPALLARIHGDAKVNFRINYGYPNSWPNRKAVKQFVQQMHDMKLLRDLNADSLLIKNAVLLEEGRQPIFWVVLLDGRAIKWKEFVLESNGPNTKPCKGLPSVDMDDLEEGSELTDQCIGEMYDNHGNKM